MRRRDPLAAEPSGDSSHLESIGIADGQIDLGHVLLGVTNQGICYLSLGGERSALRADVAATFPRARLDDGNTTAQRWLDNLRPTLEAPGSEAVSPPLDLRGTAFQRLVWQALRQIPAGTTCSYRQLANLIGRASATRAVAGACAANPVGVIVPCHRVVRSNGGLGGYHWGVSIKRDLLRREGALQPPSEGSH